MIIVYATTSGAFAMIDVKRAIKNKSLIVLGSSLVRAIHRKTICSYSREVWSSKNYHQDSEPRKNILNAYYRKVLPYRFCCGFSALIFHGSFTLSPFGRDISIDEMEGSGWLSINHFFGTDVAFPTVVVIYEGNVFSEGPKI